MRVFSTVFCCPSRETLRVNEWRLARKVLRIVVVALLALVVCASATRVGAQTTNATINGQITDSQGKIVPAADVQAVNIDTGVAYSGKTNDSGIYVIPALLPGPYRIVVKKDGFREINKVGIVLHVQDTLEQNFALEVGSVTESITVGAAEGDVTRYHSVRRRYQYEYYGRRGEYGDRSRLHPENMPLNGNSLSTLFELVPGAVTNASGGAAE